MNWFWKKPIEAASNIAERAATTGLHIWDNAAFKPQERAKAYLDYLKAIKDQGTSIARREFLKAIIWLTVATMTLAIVYNHFGMTTELEGLRGIIKDWYLGYAFVGASCFYFGTHLVAGLRPDAK